MCFVIDHHHRHHHYHGHHHEGEPHGGGALEGLVRHGSVSEPGNHQVGRGTQVIDKYNKQTKNGNFDDINWYSSRNHDICHRHCLTLLI